MVFDIDDFKRYNDDFGHEVGDEVLKETVRLLRSVIRRGDHVFRIGGDEFVVIFADDRAAKGGSPPESIEVMTDRFRRGVSQLRLTRLGREGPGRISISAGVATFPWDGLDGPTLLAHADRLAIQSKRSGKNTISFGPGSRPNGHGP
jgi:diguanylate cyclase (GGDEF)-like protein